MISYGYINILFGVFLYHVHAPDAVPLVCINKGTTLLMDKELHTPSGLAKEVV
jgi:hypothetical protein